MSISPISALQIFIDRLSIHSVFSNAERDAVLALPTLAIHITKKQDFVKINEDTPYAFLIASGMVARFGMTSAGARQITAFHIPGDMADLYSIVRPVGIGGLSALCDTQIIRIPHTSLRALTARFPAIAEAFWRDCTLNAAVLTQWVLNVGRRDARARLAHILCEMAVRFGGGRETSHRYAFPVTQEQLGDATALTAIHVNRSLKTLRHLVTIKHGAVHIHDWNQLAIVGEFEPAYLVADTVDYDRRRLLAAV